ncbi:hypothetical protein N7501_009772 [Penicillium viridicatum]|nr:hypothetical protein N7501_009772 [Penicillium viridicatum]
MTTHSMRFRVRNIFSWRKNAKEKNPDQLSDASENSPATTGNIPQSDMSESLKPGIPLAETSSHTDNKPAADLTKDPWNQAYEELMAEADQQLLRHLVLMDPRETKQYHEDGLLQGTNEWILDSPEFKEWQVKEDSVLWIGGDIGTGKTMLMTSIINYLEALVKASDSGILAFHFFQYHLVRANNAEGMLRSLIYLLVSQQNWLLTYLREKHSAAGIQSLEEGNAFYALSSVFQDMLHDPRLTQVYLVVDALDECQEGLPLLLDLIDRTKHDPASRVKWIVSSRRISPIESKMLSIEGCVNVTLGQSPEYRADLERYIDYRVSQLARKTDLRDGLQDDVRKLFSKHTESFLFAALTFNHIRRVKRRELQHFLDIMDMDGGQNSVPGQLLMLYDQIFTDIEKPKGSEIARHSVSVISVVVLAHRPLHFLELSALTDVEDQESEGPTLRHVLDACGSVLQLRDNFVRLLHVSARDYVLKRYPVDEPLVHFNLFSRSLRALSGVLRRDMYNIHHVGTSSVGAKLQIPNPNPLASIGYCSVFWANHICNAVKGSSQYAHVLSDHGEVFSFLKRHFLHLLESLSLMGRLSEGIPPLRLLLRVIQVCQVCHGISKDFTKKP